jgi:hypothetical protein
VVPHMNRRAQMMRLGAKLCSSLSFHTILAE